MTATLATVDLLERILPAIAVCLWVAIYVVYIWHDPDLRRWLARTALQFQPRRRRAPPAPAHGHAPLLFRPAPSVRPAPAARLTARPATASSAAPVQVAAWQAARLPLRYRLLGQVRAASNDN